MEIRPARPEDAVQITEVHVRCWQSGYHGLMPQDYLDSLDPAQRVGLRGQILATVDWSRGGSLVVVDGRDVVGFADFGPTRDPGEDASRVGEVMAIYLAADAWGKGFGRQLMAASLSHLMKAGYDQVTVWVLDTNVQARRFYAAAGFQPDGAVKYDDSRGFRLRSCVTASSWISTRSRHRSLSAAPGPTR